MEDLTAKFEHIYQIVSTENFLQKRSIGGEIPFYISAYNPVQELNIQEEIKSLKKKLKVAGIVVLDINIYDLVCDILEEQEIINKLFKVEKKRSKEKFLKALQSSLNIHEVLMPKIQELIDKHNANVYFITGIGLVFPYLRSHSVLNNLQSVAKDAPTLMFFPGQYTGQSLNLFGLLKDDNYYRAFNIDKIEA